MSTVASRPAEAENNIIDTFFTAVSDDLKLLAVLNGKELTHEVINQLKAIDFPLQLGLLLNGLKIRPALISLNRAVRNWPETLPADKKDILDMDFAGIYLNHAYRASPQESVWLDEENLAMQQSMFQVREFYKHYGLEVENWRIRPDDHLVTQIQFIAYVISCKPDSDTLRHVTRFLDEHLLRWIVSFAERAATRCETSFYASLVLVTAYYLEELRDLLAEILAEPRPSQEEINKRMKAGTETADVPLQYVPGLAESW